MSLPDTEKGNTRASGEAEDISSEGTKQPQGTFKDYLVPKAITCALQFADQIVVENIQLRRQVRLEFERCRSRGEHRRWRRFTFDDPSFWAIRDKIQCI